MTLVFASRLAAQDMRQVAGERSLPPTPTLEDFRGHWHYSYSLNKPALTTSQCNDLADALRDVQVGAPRHALSWIVKEEDVVRHFARTDGRKRLAFAQVYFMTTGSKGEFYEKSETNGGWQRNATVGTTLQILAEGDALIQRVDEASPNIASPFFLATREPELHVWDRCLLAAEWIEHRAILAYCREFGEVAKPGRIHVPPDRFSQRPPYSVVCPLVGDRLSMLEGREGPAIYYT
ncbi:MAG: hypothetical protein K8H99_02920, partial [Nitrospirae bacterium]|nr:hypothetical protein [Fimbriimonadaceae bacterium]